jgi:hypothetical protein
MSFGAEFKKPAPGAGFLYNFFIFQSRSGALFALGWLTFPKRGLRLNPPVRCLVIQA